jgi:hypothetical protein
MLNDPLPYLDGKEATSEKIQRSLEQAYDEYIQACKPFARSGLAKPYSEDPGNVLPAKFNFQKMLGTEAQPVLSEHDKERIKDERVNTQQQLLDLLTTINPETICQWSEAKQIDEDGKNKIKAKLAENDLELADLELNNLPDKIVISIRYRIPFLREINNFLYKHGKIRIKITLNKVTEELMHRFQA